MSSGSTHPPYSRHHDPFRHTASHLTGGIWQSRRSSTLGRSASDGRLPSAGSSIGSRPRTGERPPTVQLNKGLARIARGERVCSLLQQPLPPKGADYVLEYTKRASVGPLPNPPVSLAVTRSQQQHCHGYDDDYRSSLLGQRTSEQWCGFLRDFHSEYTEQVVKQRHIMR